MKSLKPSTRQRFVSISFDFPSPAIEAEIIAAESGLPEPQCIPLATLAQRLRTLKDVDLEEVVSTRLLIYCATLLKNGLDPQQAAEAALVEPLCDDPEVKQGLLELINATFGQP